MAETVRNMPQVKESKQIFIQSLGETSIPFRCEQISGNDHFEEVNLVSGSSSMRGYASFLGSTDQFMFLPADESQQQNRIIESVLQEEDIARFYEGLINIQKAYE